MRGVILLCFSIITLLSSSCKNKSTNIARQYLNESKLNHQLFHIDPTKDTVLLSSSGIRLHISQGSFDGTDIVEIDFKEALDFTTMLQAGLFTTTSGNLLSSTGMFHFDTDNHLAIKKPIRIEVPTQNAIAGMQLYKGEEVNGSIDWTDPQPIPSTSKNGTVINGNTLFTNHCASCHLVDRFLTAPPLAGATERWGRRNMIVARPAATNGQTSDSQETSVPADLPKNNNRSKLYSYTRNNQKYVAAEDYDGYGCCINASTNTAMPNFEALTDADLDALYKYIDAETERMGLDIRQFETGCDSCQEREAAYETLLMERAKLTNKQGKEIDTMKLLAFTPVTVEIGSSPKPYMQSVVPVPYNADYYNITISDNGWYNIDILLSDRDNVSQSRLMVHVAGANENNIQVYLAIPNFKVLAEGGYLGNTQTIGFKNEDGSLPLPQHVPAFIFAMGEEKGVFYFGKKWFDTRADQTIEVTMKTLTKADFDRELASLQTSGLKIQTDSVAPKGSLQAIDKALQQMENGPLKNCLCVQPQIIVDYVEGPLSAPSAEGMDSSYSDEHPN